MALDERELETALTYGHRALTGTRQPLPSLLNVSRELGTIVRDQYGSDPPSSTSTDSSRSAIPTPGHVVEPPEAPYRHPEGAETISVRLQQVNNSLHLLYPQE